jgi:hypothetical protein
MKADDSSVGNDNGFTFIGGERGARLALLAPVSNNLEVIHYQCA